MDNHRITLAIIDCLITTKFVEVCDHYGDVFYLEYIEKTNSLCILDSQKREILLTVKTINDTSRMVNCIISFLQQY